MRNQFFERDKRRIDVFKTIGLSLGLIGLGSLPTCVQINHLENNNWVITIWQTINENYYLDRSQNL